MPPSAPALAHLRELALDGFPTKDGQLSAAMLGAMTSLTLLRISRSNCESVPAAIATAASLKVLILAFNNSLKFWEDQIAIFMNMPQLETIKVSMEKTRGLGCGSVSSMMKLSKSLPALEIVMEDGHDRQYCVFPETTREVWSRVREP